MVGVEAWRLGVKGPSAPDLRSPLDKERVCCVGPGQPRRLGHPRGSTADLHLSACLGGSALSRPAFLHHLSFSVAVVAIHQSFHSLFYSSPLLQVRVSLKNKPALFFVTAALVASGPFNTMTTAA